MGAVPPTGTVSARRAGLLRSHGAGGCAVVRRIRRTCRRPLVWVLCAASGTDVLSVFLARRLVWLLSQRLLDAAGHCMHGGVTTASDTKVGLRRHSHTKWAQGPVNPKRPHELMEYWAQR
jgi:hypothetical protein